MKRNLLFLAALMSTAFALGGCFETPAPTQSAPDISGDWRLTVKGSEYRLHLIQNGATLTGNLLRLNGEEPVDEIKGRINKDGTVDFLRGRLNEDFSGRITSNTSMPLQLGGKMMGQTPWTADKATNGLAKEGGTPAPSASSGAPGPGAGPGFGTIPGMPTTPELTEEKAKAAKKGHKTGAKGAGGFTNANCPPGWRLDTRSAHNETEFICVFKSCSCEDKNNGKCEFDAIAALDQIKAPKNYTCVVESDDCTIWCEQSDALL